MSTTVLKVVLIVEFYCINMSHVNISMSHKNIAHLSGSFRRQMLKTLTHLCQVDSSTLTLWTGPFPIHV